MATDEAAFRAGELLREGIAGAGLCVRLDAPAASGGDAIAFLVVVLFLAAEGAAALTPGLNLAADEFLRKLKAGEPWSGADIDSFASNGTGRAALTGGKCARGGKDGSWRSFRNSAMILGKASPLLACR